MEGSGALGYVTGIWGGLLRVTDTPGRPFIWCIDPMVVYVHLAADESTVSPH